MDRKPLIVSAGTHQRAKALAVNLGVKLEELSEAMLAECLDRAETGKLPKALRKAKTAA